MIIKDNATEYDTELIDEWILIPKDERSSVQRDILDYFVRLCYLRYTHVRLAVASNHCNKLLVGEYTSRVSSGMYANKLLTLGFSVEEALYYKDITVQAYNIK